MTAQGQLTFRHLQQRNILIFRGYSHFYQSGYTSLPLVMGQSFIIIIEFFRENLFVIIYNRLYIFTILPSIVDDPVTVDLKMMRDE